MCRSIKPLFNLEPPASEVEIREAALQFVRKVSGFTKPSRANEAAFLEAVERVTAASTILLGSLEARSRPRDRAALPARHRKASASTHDREVIPAS
jgi:hypothetical protein